jgi:nucleoside-diphosphate-sugar epimerase
MGFVRLLRARWRRRISIEALGPNEARLAYDAGVGALGVAISVGFCLQFLAGSSMRRLLPVLPLPALLLAFNYLFGIYSRLRTASGRVKAIALLGATVSASLADAAIGGPPAPVLLWLMLVFPPLALARLLLGLPYGRHKKLISIAVNHRGPVLVIGGAGYIGSHAVDLLLQAGRQVRILDRLMYGREPIQAFLTNKNWELIEGDATDIAKLTQAMKGASAVVHLAGLVGDPACAIDEDFTRHTNIIATRMAKEVAHSMGVRRFVFASSCSVYGVSEKEAGETDELHPVSLYARTKIDSETELLASQHDDFFVTILRFATVFGHSRRPRFDLVANLFTAQAITDGLITVTGPTQWRPFIHVRDLARAILLVLDTEPIIIQNQIFNVGDKRLNMTIQQLAEIVQAVCSRYRSVRISVSENREDRRNYAVSFKKIQEILDFKAETLMAPGIEEMAVALHEGRYGNYLERVYSNFAMTAQALSQFQDPAESAHLYAPLKVSAAWPSR